MWKIAEGIGFQEVFYYDDDINFNEVLLAEGPVFVHVKIDAGNADVPIIPMEAVEIRNRFMDEIKK